MVRISSTTFWNMFAIVIGQIGYTLSHDILHGRATMIVFSILTILSGIFCSGSLFQAQFPVKNIGVIKRMLYYRLAEYETLVYMCLSTVVGAFLSVSTWGAVADFTTLVVWLIFSWGMISYSRFEAKVPCSPFVIEEPVKDEIIEDTK